MAVYTEFEFFWLEFLKREKNHIELKMIFPYDTPEWREHLRTLILDSVYDPITDTYDNAIQSLYKIWKQGKIVYGSK